MANVFYSMAGEGRGHATRARTIIENLRNQGHTVTAFAPEFSYQLLTDCYKDSPVTVKQIPGLMFHYNRQKLSYTKTTSELCRYLWNLPQLINTIQDEMLKSHCDLAITDFEPALPRAARRLEIPWISVDHQHFLVVSDFAELSILDRMKTSAMGLGVRQYYSGQDATVVSSFYFPPLKRGIRTCSTVWSVVATANCGCHTGTRRTCSCLSATICFTKSHESSAVIKLSGPCIWPGRTGTCWQCSVSASNRTWVSGRLEDMPSIDFQRRKSIGR